MRRLLPAFAVALLFAPGPTLGQRPTTGAGARQVIEYRLVNGGDAARVEIIIPDVGSGRVQRRSITDLMLRLSLVGGDVTEALRLPNGAAVDRDDGLMRAAVYLVSGGRLLRETEARCDRWADDIAICKVGCDGGAFALRRNVGRQSSTLSLIVGSLPRGNEADNRRGFALDACQDAGGDDRMLSPAGGRDQVEIGVRRP